MVILDTKDKVYGENTNILYLNLIDIDYIVKKYGLDTLRQELPVDYVEGFERALHFSQGEEELSIQYYSVSPMVIEDENDKFLSILCNEIQEGNIFTKSQLQELAKEDLSDKIKELEDIKEQTIELTPEQLYKLRSYNLAEFIKNNIISAQARVDDIFEGQKFSMEFRQKMAQKQCSICFNNLNAVGLSDEIYESDYFKEFIPLNR